MNGGPVFHCRVCPDVVVFLTNTPMLSSTFSLDLYLVFIAVTAEYAVSHKVVGREH